ncbi:MAG: ABC transporter ATP-binding protein [Firmicutes bacterium]|nr:ABC transporter ATP-binding protein [Bacillota bacterium]
MEKKLIQFKNIVKSFEDGKIVLKGINLDIHENEFVTLLGPSGCGKTTLLRILGGFLSQDQGQLLFDGEEISNKPPYMREINTVFQKYALFPHMNVYDNIAFGLKLKKEPKDIIEQKVKRMLKLVNLEDYANRSVTALSGGQQQRIAIARALVNEPSVLLLDEPLGALDLKLRKEMQHELKKIQQEVGITFIYVTHDQEEALTMSDKIVVMKEGEIQQIGTPTDIYNEPVNAYVANFIGESNIIEGVMVDDYKVAFEGKKFDCVDYGFDKNEVVDVVIRPEDLDIVPPGEGKLKGVVKSVLFKGVHYETMVETKVGTEITVKMQVSNDRPVYNEAANEKMSANDFYLDMNDVDELDDATIIARADAQAWNPDEDELISIKEVQHSIQKANGTYPVTFSTAAGTSVTVNMIVKDENSVTSEENEEEIFAVNFYKKVDEIQESIALDTDLKTWANASAWSLEDSTAVEITDVKYQFDPEKITPGTYDVTFATKGYQYKIDTTDKFEVDDVVGLMFQPEDIHIMSKSEF